MDQVLKNVENSAVDLSDVSDGGAMFTQTSRHCRSEPERREGEESRGVMRSLSDINNSKKVRSCYWGVPLLGRLLLFQRCTV
jgi:hypothetical protein